VVLEPGAGPLDIDALRASVAQRLPDEPRVTQRVGTSGPEPHWVTAEDFDITEHIRRRELPDCISQADLWKAVAS
jgi:diacylglycerol O-acyltransferase / wax synthase